MPDEKYGPVTGMMYVEVGGKRYYTDGQGGLHKLPADAIRENQRVEVDQSRGASGACSQDPDLVPPPPPDPPAPKK